MAQKKEAPRITVLMAIYNCGPTLAEAIDSLYAQTYQNFKLVLCDDGSTDDTYAVAKEYAERYDNIVLLKNEQNIKLAASLNRCLEYADTEDVARIDGDDISLPTRFEKEIDFLDNHPEYSLVSTPMILFDETGDWGRTRSIEKPTKEDFKKGTPHPHAPSMIRTKVMKEVNGYTVNKYLERGQDYYLWYKIYKAGYKGYNLQEPLYKMRDDKDAMARRKPKDRLKALVVYFKVGRGLGISPALYDLVVVGRIFMKIIIPPRLMGKIRSKKLSK